ncbi:phage protein : Phage protein OS=Acetonema longum DSM 6540 GN=ALO_17461 PE=4 SV=1 [Gemmataceae bacterium]|nr:phage protein : Phage protein OS=Acetonema longum DSM 6540 GN=ALO_17461 PE=4 SV=1 [Gemmataceae bacterium]VTU02487.1 phage protein : Phage protein OS=Acetonema longum DSM 6540 GN=ALO_17461 PE=4 SV=1 [Gemmataceae bacterium]
MAEQRKKNEDALLLALACGATVEAAARQCGLTDRTIYRRLSEPAFKDRLQALRTDMVARAAGMLTAAAGEAVRTLLQLQKDAPATVRLGAAKAVLEVGMKLREIVDLEARMAALEARLAEQDKPGPRGLYA